MRTPVTLHQPSLAKYGPLVLSSGIRLQRWVTVSHLPSEFSVTQPGGDAALTLWGPIVSLLESLIFRESERRA